MSKCVSPRNGLRLKNYDCIGFDMDCTLVRYKLEPFWNLVHDLIVKSLVEEKNYDRRLLDTKYDSKWCQKGLILDKKRGHILRIGSKYEILKASHGMRFLSEEQITSSYGPSKIYEPLKNTFSNYIEKGTSWDSSFIILKDFFSSLYSSLFSEIVDVVGPRDDYSDVCHDMYQVLVKMYHRRAMLEGTGGFFSAFEANPSKFVHEASPELRSWLQNLRRSGIKLFMMTSSNADFANLLMEHSYGGNWKSYFDLVITYARKPLFFSSRTAFQEVAEDNGDGKILTVEEMSLHNTYCRGNQEHLQEFFSRTLDKCNPRFLYFGDSVMDDVYAPSSVGWDTAAVVEEVEEDSRRELASHWGSFFCEASCRSETLFGNVIRSTAVLTVPSMESCRHLTPESPFAALPKPNHGHESSSYFLALPRCLQ